MDSLATFSASIVLPLHRHRHRHRHRHHCRRRLTGVSFTCNKSIDRFRISTELSSWKQSRTVYCKLSGQDGENDRRDEELETAMRMDGTIPGTSDAFLKQVSSRAYDMRRRLKQTVDTSSYDVLEANPWREASKSVYVLTHQENQLCTMKTRTNKSEVERELGLLFSRGRKWRNQSGSTIKFQMLVEDVREAVLVFEDENEAAKYCNLLQGRGQNCEAVAEIDASSVFDLCQKNSALAVLFRRGRTPPLPESLKRNLGGRKQSLEDQNDSI